MYVAVDNGCGFKLSMKLIRNHRFKHILSNIVQPLIHIKKIFRLRPV